MNTDRILFVDDDANVLAGYKRSLNKRFELITALSGDNGLSCLAKEGPFAVVIADMQMPGMDGITFLRNVQERAPDTVRLMLTGNADQKTAADAVNHGHVFSFLTKPCPAKALESALSNALKQYRLVVAEKELLEQTLNGAIRVLTEILSVTDPCAFGRAQRLREEMKTIAKQFCVAKSWELELGAMLSQVGYVAIPNSVIVKARSGATLTGSENDMLARVPETGANLIGGIPRLGSVAETVRYQCKNFDGSGLPHDNVSGEAIPIGARILRILNDLLDEESEHRSRSRAFTKLRNQSERYDLKVLEAIASCFDVYLDVSFPESGLAIPQKVSDLVVGSILAADVRTKDGTLLITANTRLTSPLLEKLKNFDELSGLEEPLTVWN